MNQGGLCKAVQLIRHKNKTQPNSCSPGLSKEQPESCCVRGRILLSKQVFFLFFPKNKFLYHDKKNHSVSS